MTGRIEKALPDIVTHMRRAFGALDAAGIEDEKVASRYIEYLVALKLTKHGHVIQNLRRRGTDIILEGEIKIEVKSGKYGDGSSGASFGKGSQIREGKFDYCVFVPYDKTKVKEFLIFSRKELAEVAEKRREFARFPKTNPHLLVRCNSLKDLEKRFESSGWEKLKIEDELHRYPERFRDRWNKIKPVSSL